MGNGRRIAIRVPASTANLGSGFDVLGLALGLYNTIEMETTSRGVEVTVEGEGAERLQGEGKRSLVVRAAEAAFAHLGVTPPGLKVHLRNEIPLKRGLGSSGTACLGGIIGAAELTGRPLSREEILKLALPLEGHPDNITPSLVGGLTASCLSEGEVRYVRIPLPEAITVVAVIPEQQLSTAEARRALPRQVPFADAVHNVSRVALLVGAMVAGDLSLLDEATRDRLHQPYRAKLLPGMEEVLEVARRGGALAAFLSGAGSTVVALVNQGAETVGAEMAEAWARIGLRAEVKVLAIDREGIQLS
ncbi:MAG: homoserine kinase [candidate division NC10 bacterium]|nr:homoserine kinase [candidate division NC10 bacterium]